jgi:hypothetical protein
MELIADHPESRDGAGIRRRDPILRALPDEILAREPAGRIADEGIGIVPRPREGPQDLPAAGSPEHAADARGDPLGTVPALAGEESERGPEIGLDVAR